MLKVSEFLKICNQDVFVFIRYERETKITKSDLDDVYGRAQELLDKLNEIELNYYIQHYAINPHDPMIIALHV